MGFPTWAFLAQLLLSTSIAQLTSNATCADLERYIGFNASVTRQIPALAINGSKAVTGGDPTLDFSVVNDTTRTWSLKLGVSASRNPPSYLDSTRYSQTLLLDTADSNLTEMGSCHHTVQAEQFTSNFQWTKERLERSLDDNGDCMTLLGSECVAALKRWYARQGAQAMMLGDCSATNTTFLEECSMPPLKAQGKYFTLLLYLRDGQFIGNSA